MINRDFLLGSFSFVEQTALNLLADYGEVDLLLSLAKARGLVIDALTCLVRSESFSSIPFSTLGDLVQRGFCAHLIQSGNGCLLPYLSPEDFLKLVTLKPQLAIQNFALLKPIIPLLNQNQLLELARIFDPSKSVMRGMLVKMQTKRRRTNSLTSVASLTSESLDMDFQDLQADVLVDFFLLVVLHLNQQRRQTNPIRQMALNLNTLVSSPADELENMEKEPNSSETKKKLTIQPQPIACGPKHSAIIRNGDLYTCGKSHNGRLGLGDLPQSSCPPTRVENLHTLQLRVESVACGSEHTLALTQQGVYCWGNSKYGQVGVGTTYVYKRPMLLETLQSDTVVAVDCGQYHSLALTADHQVYTWGWGVHGQLGHGDPEDCLTPKHVAYLLNLVVVRIAGGYAHSLVLTDSGDVWSFGCGYFGQLGLGINNKTTYPQKVSLPSPVTVIGTKYFQCVAVTVTNKVYTWGLHPQNLRQIASSIRSARLSGSNYQDQNAFMFPSLVDTTYVHGKVTKVCCGSLHNVLLTDDGAVYLWGRNLEGQLGTGSRQDERIPKMLTSINDQHIVAIASGGEFTLAFSNDGCIWAWGKNDAGQLGFVKPRKETQPLLVATSNAYRKSANNSNEVNMPSIMRGLPTPDPSSAYWVAMLSSLTQDVLWTDPHGTGNESTWDNLPSLDKLGSDIYDKSVVPVTLKILADICESDVCLQHCVNTEDWLTAGHISWLNGDYVQALQYRLKVVTCDQVKMEDTDVVTLCAQLVKYHIHQIIEKTQSTVSLNSLLQQISFN
ncbi:E3 ubiquitin-protein ligase herc2, partial [Bulinus truncatus]